MIDQLHQAIIDHLTSQLQGIEVLDYAPITKRTALPCARLNLEQITPNSKQPGNGQTSLNCRFNLFLVAVPEVDQAEISLQSLAALAIHALHKPVRLIPSATSTIRVEEAGPNGYDPAFDGFLVWQVDFVITLLVGDVTSWIVPGLPPAQILLNDDYSTESAPLEEYEVIA
jgi:hypothetical protein